MTGRNRHFSDAFKQEAVELALSNGLSRVQTASDLGVGLSTLTKWISHYREADLLSGPHDDKDKELARLRKENQILRMERDILKKATAFFAREGR